jgi:predicted metal-dependent phosphoesterase TrpH
MSPSTAGLRISAESAIDLHLHTNHSDGRWAPEQLLDHLQREQFGLAAIADHDRPDMVATIQTLALDKGMPMLVAVEMTTTWQGEPVDLLCFGFDPNQNALNDLARDLLRRQQENTREVYDNLRRQGYGLPSGALPSILATPSARQPFALVDLLKERGYGLGEPPAGKILSAAGCTFATNEPAAVVDAAHRSGAVCLLAHPGRGDGFTIFDTQLLDRFRREVPIDGLEVYYPLHTPAKTAMFREYARPHGLLVSAGSDSHGPDKPPTKFRAELCRGLLKRLGIQLVTEP